MSHYLPDDVYRALVARLMADPAPGLDRRSHIVTTLGEVADLWPESVRDEAEAA
ncbi:hypothetical protein GQF56_10475 [Rhodobacter sphaeroides]|jgi:hypothetical protein|uniref:Uncharacterized protein n=1 Tax=Cereibacter sphaeroides (strain ATCC 17023 / DSM 158 / JCM 6121 / CCUG 31486 / LMG 2827 / NBRC 12203 / NCIMB 8253 / ATH 2.4.1.) TaxID=272943 RepID=Q3J3X9_CERS4|nr:hypothetical protein [Cereibacter sphaeroides]ABA78505.1 hypothetical protein RSP_6223 [Cereibacter sphaeroides 2.4.1]AXC60725.1 hypothetical protein DQL45_04900 [Cereibacter sphaeroides 2.4.1]MVX48299.1 hypothetical protein [Cereibacter sphaeroides]QHA12975.1 hypothetical protein GQY06_04890 [Cereibacter sphaeroides]QJC84307.1 hypothetical protein HGN32_08990 [Cereibacter sphaeroides]